MARKLTESMTFDDLEDECMFTTAALQADENAADLVSMTSSWMPAISDVRGIDLSVRQTAANVDAARIVANYNLDLACVSFGDELYLACGKDRQSNRWTQFFRERVSEFTKMALSEQTSRVNGWLTSASDPVLENHRADLTKWATSAATALTNTAGLSSLRAQVWQKREQLAKDLTDGRDKLEAALGDRARERGLPREWPATFFRVVKKNEKQVTEPTATQGSSAASGTDATGTAGAPPA